MLERYQFGKRVAALDLTAAPQAKRLGAVSRAFEPVF
jgi:hypothetical protein